MIEPFSLPINAQVTPKLVGSLISKPLRMRDSLRLELDNTGVSSFSKADLIVVHWHADWVIGQGYLLFPERKNSFGQPLIFQPSNGSWVVFAGTEKALITRSTLTADLHYLSYA